jgi:hypothetical protein
VVVSCSCSMLCNVFECGKQTWKTSREEFIYATIRHHCVAQPSALSYPPELRNVFVSNARHPLPHVILLQFALQSNKRMNSSRRLHSALQPSQNFEVVVVRDTIYMWWVEECGINFPHSPPSTVLYYLQFTGCRDPKPSFLSAVAVDQPWREAVQYFLDLT